MRTDDPEFWNLMFSADHYVFGEAPNQYLKDKLSNLSSGKVLLPGEGEGRNAVYCAEQGWEVSAFDLSKTGKEKAEELAKKRKVNIDFKVGDVPDLNYPEASFDALVLIFAHFMPEKRAEYHQKLSTYLKSGGKLILEGHARMDEDTIDMRFNLDELKNDFKDYKLIECSQELAHLEEGQMIQGETNVVRIYAEKQ